jgi:hypothetical protein
MSITHRPQNALQRYGDGFLFAAAVAVCLQILVAISTDLQLFGDGVWYLLKMAFTRHYAYWIADWHTQFFQSRIGTYLVVETPVVVAIHLGVHSLRALSKIFGFSLYLPWILSIYICYRQTRERVYLLFPVLSLVAGSMNSGAFIINESHLMAALYWSVLFILLFQEELTPPRKVLLLALSAPMLLCYESMAFFGTILAAVCLYRRRAPSAPKGLYLGLALWYLAGAAIAVASIVYPFDPSNRSAFLKGMRFLLFESDHLGVQISVTCLICITLTLVISRRIQWLRVVSFSAGSTAVLYLASEVLVGRQPYGLDIEVHARTLNFAVPLGLSLLMLAVWVKWIRPDARSIALVSMLTGALGIAQSFFIMGAAVKWTGMLATLRVELAQHTGPVLYQHSLMSRRQLGPLCLKRLHGNWPLLPLSIYESEHGMVQSLVLPEPDSFFPFDPYAPQSLPKLSAYRINYDAYKRAVEKDWQIALGHTIDFTSNGSSGLFLGKGWSSAENWATWTQAQEFDLKLLMAPDPKPRDVSLEAHVGPNLTPSQPSLSVEIFVNGVYSGRWEFYQIPEFAIRTEQLRVPADIFWKAQPVHVAFKINEPLKSPEEMRQGADPRKLGLAFLKMRISAAE